MILLIQLIVLGILIAVIAYMVVISYLVYRGCNYIPTPRKDIDTALLVLQQGDTFIDLGFGNGEVMQEAARKGAKRVEGYELDFVRYLKTILRLRRDAFKGYSFHYADIWSADLSRADVVFTFFTVIHMKKLYSKAKKEMRKGTWFVSYVHEVPGIEPTKKVRNVRFFRI